MQVQVVSEQLGRTSPNNIFFMTILRRIQVGKGLAVLYRGLDSAIFRQLFYASARLGAYDVSIQHLEKHKQAKASNA